MGAESALAVPLHAGDEPIGLLVAYPGAREVAETERTLQIPTRRTPPRCGGPLTTIAGNERAFVTARLFVPGDRREQTVGRRSRPGGG